MEVFPNLMECLILCRIFKTFLRIGAASPMLRPEIAILYSARVDCEYFRHAAPAGQADPPRSHRSYEPILASNQIFALPAVGISDSGSVSAFGGPGHNRG